MNHEHDRRRGPRVRADLRISDADREEAVARLGDHYAAGRLDKEELDERSDAVWTAKTGADLAPIFADLGGVPGAGRTRPGPGVRRGWFRVPFVPVLFVLIALTVVTHVPFVLLAFVACAFVLSRRRRHWW